MSALHDRAAAMAAAAEPYMAADAALEAACNVAQVLVLRPSDRADLVAFDILRHRERMGVPFYAPYAACALAMADSWAATGKESERGGVGEDDGI